MKTMAADDLKTLNGEPVSTLTFGTMQFGGRADAAESQAMYEAARAAGVTHFDTAVRYTDGKSEELTGQFIAKEREAVFLATKVAFTGGASRSNILSQFDESRRQLGQDQVDLLYLHRWNDNPLEETFETLADLQSQGRIRYIGLSNAAAWQVMKAQAVAARFGTRIDALQPMYNLVKRQAEVEILPMAVDQSMAVFPYSPLGGGLLTGKYVNGGTGRLTEDDMYRQRYGHAWMHEAAQAFADVAAEVGVSPATLAVAWVAGHPAAPRPIVSAKSVAQLMPSLAAGSYVMAADLRERISALVPTPPLATDRLEEQ